MRKSLPKYFLSGALVALTTTSAWAGPTLEEQVQALSRQNQAQSKLLQELQKKVAAQVGQSNDDSKGGLLQAINDHVELSALVEVEAGSSEDYSNEDSSDITLATVEIGLDAQVSEWSSAHLLLLYEEGEEDDHLIIDEGTITLGNTEKLPLYLTVGKMYVPFGSFESNMVSDPLTLEIGETGDSAAQVGFEENGFYGSVYVFNGDINEAGEDDEINNFGVNLGFVMENDTMALDIGVDWINNIGDTDGIGDFLADRGVANPEEIDDYVSGLSLHAVFSTGPFTLIGEYVTALDDFEQTEVDFKGRGAEPEAYNLEAAFTTELFNRETTFALGYQATDEALALDLPESRYIGTVSMELLPYTALAIEYFHDEDYDTSDGGTGEDANTLTMQLALEF